MDILRKQPPMEEPPQQRQVFFGSEDTPREPAPFLFAPEEELSIDPQELEWEEPRKKRISLWRQVPGVWRIRQEWLWRGGIGFLFLLIALIIYGFLVYGSLQRSLEQGLHDASAGVEALQAKQFTEAQADFASAESQLHAAKRKTLFFPPLFAKALVAVPGLHKGASGILALDAGWHLARAGQAGAVVAQELFASKEGYSAGKPVSFLEVYATIEGPLVGIEKEVGEASSSLAAVRPEDVPENSRTDVALLQAALPGIATAIGHIQANKPMIEELLGAHGPRKYLFLFQNNQELRPTGGFIGSYGLLDFKDGIARQFFIDGIFNPDGQLSENIVPPKPIQKVSAGWSLHDSNWFPDFPTSAEKAISFYEKTGGPTVDGVFTLTPTVMERLLSVVGPIELPDYGITVDEKNFVPLIQEQVEEKYDKEENKPKKILSDLAGILLERVFSESDPVALYNIANVMVAGMNEKQILLYTRDQPTENLIRSAGWSGEISATPKDYLEVVHTNLNGFKTDGVIKNSVTHQADIQDDGSVIVTTTIRRVHTGGNTPYEWWNQVNSDYMRVYVPKGSVLLSADGMTRESDAAPLDYDKLGFKRDPDVEQEEAAIHIDESTGTRVGEEFGKTVFGNWVYVSPGETVEVTYRYRLPFRVDPAHADTAGYSLLFEKQPGLDALDFETSVHYPDRFTPIWQSNLNLVPYQSVLSQKKRLSTDTFTGVVFETK